jgi:uncharacterized glyoxalase superfamily protein PhnB
MNQSLYPVMPYRDATAALVWMQEVLGADEVAMHRDPGGGVVHAEARVAGGIVMFGDHASASNEAFRREPGTGQVYVAVDDPDTRYERARRTGADIVRELGDTGYGSRDFAVRDLEGNTWSFGTYGP